MHQGDVDLRPIVATDVDRVARFLHLNLNPRIPPEQWLPLLSPPWPVPLPNRGFQLVADHQVVGAYVTVSAKRESAGSPVSVCNLAAFCVLEPYRPHSIRLMRAVLRQRDLEFTDLSPSGNVVSLNERLGFKRLDTRTKILVNMPLPPRRGIELTTDDSAISAALSGRDAQIFIDHRNAPAARHLLIRSSAAHAYLMFRKDRRKGLGLFATPLYAAGDRDLLRSAWPQVGSHFFMHQSAPLTLAERRVLGFEPSAGFAQKTPRPKMFRSTTLAAADVDYLYSEMTLLEW